MSTPDDEDAEALSWAGDEERGRAAPRRPGRSRIEPVETSTPDDAEERGAGTSGLLLVVYGILAGAYAIFTLGWITSVVGSGTALTNLAAEILYQLGEFLAIALPALWFVAVLWLERRPPRRLLWLLIGIPIVLPWPWVLGQ